MLHLAEKSGRSRPMSSDAPNWSYISHELRTPLNHIIGYSELLIEEADERKEAALIEPLQQIRAKGKQLVSMLGEVFKQDIPESPLLRLKMAHDDLCAVAGRVQQSSTGLQANAPNDLLPDLKKIESAADQFVALVKQFTTP